MEITLPSEFEAFIEAKIRSGDYVDPADVVRAALGALRDQERIDDPEMAELRAAIASGIRQLDAGAGEVLDVAEIKRAARSIRKSGHD